MIARHGEPDEIRAMPQWAHPPDAGTLRTAAHIGSLVRDARLRAGLSQRALARRVGICQSSISRIEAGKMIVSMLTFYRLASALGGITVGR